MLLSLIYRNGAVQVVDPMIPIHRRPGEISLLKILGEFPGTNCDHPDQVDQIDHFPISR
ncbi:hypothetical protein PC129_g20703 [Phytophthora cactorum]|uniref:Uncharacterized protein n=1 Tax=Phytophthora cactorum TaxID=29920 RepID=A0A8T1ALX1_9STRA|nr:hypothetical protein PC111_g20787 [Phytophthora cactorum]KAG2798610.1 hypothetical protein PC112_g21276 [Phytophthora cactorum]KAG2829797.1 hypothetical protein PC113_g21226 [Phytophthora cactorum]KAG2877661.1 hypothetical protein PC114_g23521 [Phytophthora cactorum]KAG2885622.1 hypothetical protein PC115_g20949 [Phytophthora cactorum]